ncbi:uncharacterized protein [Typha latifolia]|uniref:uncharacterized protein n=1 Tax=Typha latifolia TaxID=4733 RepID=UPI003C30A866
MARMLQGAVKEKVLIKLFGVEIAGQVRDEMAALTTEAAAAAEVMRKSKSMGDLASYNPTPAAGDGDGDFDVGFLSDGELLRSSKKRRVHERKRAIPWTEEEHMSFLTGLEKLGKGDWRGISKNFVITRTPIQVASHAQKHFLRQSNPNKKKRRSRLFDVVNHDQACSSGNSISPLSMKKVHDGADMTNQLPGDSSSLQAGASSTNMNQVVYGVAESFPAIPSIRDQREVPSINSTRSMVSISRTTLQHAVPTPSLCSSLNITGTATPDFRKLYYSSLPQTQPQYFSQPAAAPIIKNDELTLSIAPPRPHDKTKVSPHGVVNIVTVI